MKISANSYRSTADIAPDPAKGGLLFRSHRYDDIIDLPHHVSTIHPPMPREARAAQFSPFAALTGYGDAVEEAARYTAERPELDQDERAQLDRQLAEAMAQPDAKPATITYFAPDPRKQGGTYKTARGRIAKVDEHSRTLVMQDGTTLPLASIVAIS